MNINITLPSLPIEPVVIGIPIKPCFRCGIPTNEVSTVLGIGHQSCYALASNGRDQIRKKRRDWFRIIRDLMSVHISMAKIASACGRDTKTIQHWTEDGEPKDSDARVVLALYAKFCPREYADHVKEFALPIPEERVF